MPAHSMTTKRWVLAVAAIALILAISGLRFGRSRWEEEADSNSRMVEFWSVEARRHLSDGTPIFKAEFFETDGSMKPHAKTRFRRLRAYHAELTQKYQFAATFSWLPVAPDPPYPTN